MPAATAADGVEVHSEWVLPHAVHGVAAAAGDGGRGGAERVSWRS